MTYTSFRIAIAVIYAALSISITHTASAASPRTCFKGWTFGYDKSELQAEIKAKIAWNSKAQKTLATSGATWARTTDRRTHSIKVFLNGQLAHKVSVYGKYCDFNLHNTAPTPVGVAG